MRVFKPTKGDVKEPKQSEIGKYKDFGKVVTNYERTLKKLHAKPLYKDPKAFLLLVLIVLLTYLIVKDQKQSEEQENNATEIELNEGN